MMVTTMPQRNEIRRPHVRGRGRAATALRRAGALPEETRELDAEYLESLLGDLGEHGMEPLAAPALAHEEEPHPADLHEEENRARAAAEDDHGPTRDIPDIWTLKGGKTPLLTAAQEIVLAKRVEHGDRHAREELLNANVRLVASVARRYMGRGLPLEDLMQEGIIGLMRAIEKYNYRKGYRFSTYATHWIRQAISRGLANQGRSIRLPAHVVDSISRIARVREELFHQLGRPPLRAEIAEAAGITEKKLILLLRSAAQPLSLETPVGEEGDSRLSDFLPAGSESSPLERVFSFMVREELEHALNTLTPREKEVIMLRYGLSDEEPHTLEDTGRRLHITRERARQIEAKALEKLRHAQVAGRLQEAVS
jgi:RNA polymerase primary sigma factor